MNQQEFLALNEGMALRELLDRVLQVDAVWDDEKSRQHSLAHLTDLLHWTCLHRASKLQELATLARRMPTNPSYHQFMSIMVPIERQHGRAIADGDFPVSSRDRLDSQSSHSMPLVLVLENLRSAFNLGSIWRLAECLGVQRIYISGYTAPPDQTKVARAALGTEHLIPWEWTPHTGELLTYLRAQGFTLVALETSPAAKKMESYVFPSKPIAMVLGNERYGLEANILQLCDAVLEIACWGQKNSLNVAVSAGIAVFELRKQWLQMGFIAETPL